MHKRNERAYNNIKKREIKKINKEVLGMMNLSVIHLIEREIERLENTKKEFPNDEWLYEPELTELKQQLKEVK